MIVAGVVDGVRHVAIDRLAGDDVTAILAGRRRASCWSGSAPSCCGARAGSTSVAVRRYLRRALVGVVAVWRPSSSCCRSAFAIVANHKARAPVERSRPRPALRRRDADDERRAAARRLVRAVAQRRGRDRLPRAAGAQSATRGCSFATATASCCSTAAARARARATSTRAAGAASRTSARPSPTCASARTSRGDRIGGLGLSVGGEMLLADRRRTTRGLRAVVSEGAGMRSAAEQKHMPGTPAGAAPLDRADHGRDGRRHRPLRPPAAGRPRGPHAADRAASRPAHPRNERQRRRGAQPRLPRRRRPDRRRSGRSRAPATPPASPPPRPSTSAG